jgi:hypothetical protein
MRDLKQNKSKFVIQLIMRIYHYKLKLSVIIDRLHIIKFLMRDHLFLLLNFSTYQSKRMFFFNQKTCHTVYFLNFIDSNNLCPTVYCELKGGHHFISIGYKTTFISFFLLMMMISFNIFKYSILYIQELFCFIPSF